jgi:hypothetical protein
MRDGAFGQVNAGRGLHDWCVRHEKIVHLVKTSAGASMSEAINDLGYMYSILHKLFASADFSCKQYEDPPGLLYSRVKKYLKEYLAPASFHTYWKCVVAMKPFMLKAFTPMTVQSALRLGGFEFDRINIRTIMGSNVEFSNLPRGQSDKVLGLIETVFCNYWFQHTLIHKNISDKVFDGEKDIDTLSNRVGKPLNDMSANRQRFMMDRV